jgi:hypothetical protein
MHLNVDRAVELRHRPRSHRHPSSDLAHNHRRTSFAMPVTFKVAPHDANRVNPEKEAWRFVSSKTDLLAPLAWPKVVDNREIFQCSVNDSDLKHLSTSNPGIVATVVEAYNRHHHLQLRSISSCSFADQTDISH